MERCQVTQSFVARIWLEGAADEDPKWRGHIQYIQGPEGIYFQDLAEMSEFLEQVSGIPSQGFAGQTQKVVDIPRRGTVTKKEQKQDK